MYDFTDNGEFIQLVIDSTRTLQIKKSYISLRVEGDYLFLYRHNKERSKKEYTFKIDYNDVTTPAVASAAALETILDGWINPSIPTPVVYSYLIAYTGNVTAPVAVGESLVWSFEIPAGTLIEGDEIEINSIWKKTSGSGSTQFNVKMHSASGTSGSVHGLYALTATQYWRNNAIILMTGANSQAGSGSINSISTGVGGGDYTTNTLALASSIFINLTCSKVTAADGVELRMATIKINKYIAP